MKLALPVVGTSTATCNGCGDCCDPVRFDVDAYRPRLAEMAGGEDPRAVKDATFILAHWTADETHESGAKVSRCDAFDPVARRCTAYETRPPVCRDFPWYGGNPTPGGLADLPRCSYRADLPNLDT